MPSMLLCSLVYLILSPLVHSSKGPMRDIGSACMDRRTRASLQKAHISLQGSVRSGFHGSADLAWRAYTSGLKV